MYVCICKGITDKDIKNVMTTHQNTKDILKALGLGSDCGQCVLDAIKLIKGESATIEFSNPAPVQKQTNQQ